jgi:hypothetical protein
MVSRRNSSMENEPFFILHNFFIKVHDQPILVGWFPANCVQLQTVSSPTTSIASSYLNTLGRIFY